MFLIKLPWKIFCYFVDGVFRVALLALLLFLLAQHTDSVLANVQGMTQDTAKKLGAANFAQVSPVLGDSLNKIKAGIRELSAKNAELSGEDGKSKNSDSKAKGDTSKPWFQAKIY